MVYRPEISTTLTELSYTIPPQPPTIPLATAMLAGVVPRVLRSATDEAMVANAILGDAATNQLAEIKEWDIKTRRTEREESERLLRQQAADHAASLQTLAAETLKRDDTAPPAELLEDIFAAQTDAETATLKSVDPAQLQAEQAEHQALLADRAWAAEQRAVLEEQTQLARQIEQTAGRLSRRRKIAGVMLGAVLGGGLLGYVASGPQLFDKSPTKVVNAVTQPDAGQTGTDILEGGMGFSGIILGGALATVIAEKRSFSIAHKRARRIVRKAQ